MQEKCEAHGRTIASLEERCVSLKSTIDQLNASLERAAGTETDLRAEIQSVQRNLLDTTASSQSYNEKLRQVRTNTTLKKIFGIYVRSRSQITIQITYDQKFGNSLLLFGV